MTSDEMLSNLSSDGEMSIAAIRKEIREEIELLKSDIRELLCSKDNEIKSLNVNLVIVKKEVEKLKKILKKRKLMKGEM